MSPKRVQRGISPTARGKMTRASRSALTSRHANEMSPDTQYKTYIHIPMDSTSITRKVVTFPENFRCEMMTRREQLRLIADRFLEFVNTPGGDPENLSTMLALDINYSFNVSWSNDGICRSQESYTKTSRCTFGLFNDGFDSCD